MKVSSHEISNIRNAMTLFMAGSVLARSSSYFVVAQRSSCLVGRRSLSRGCGTLPANVGKTDTLALPPNPDSPLVKIAKVVVAGRGPDRRSHAAARRLLARRPDAAGAAGDDLARRPVLPVRERPDRAAADDGAARRLDPRRAGAPPRRRPLHDPHRPAAARPGLVPERRGAPLQPVLLRPRQRRRRALRWPRSSTSAGSTTACTTSCSSPTG